MRWTEELAGYMSFDQTDFNQALMEGRRDGARLTLRLTLQIDDIEAFVQGAQNPAQVNREYPTGATASGHKRAWVRSGRLESPDLGGRMNVDWGEFELLAQANKLFDHLHLRMRYRLNLRDPEGRELRLAGFKVIENDPGGDSWRDTTTLFTRIYTGWWRTPYDRADEPGATAPDPWAEEDEAAAKREATSLLATAIVQISRAGFMRELTTFRGTEGSALSQLGDVLRFGECFFGGLAKAYVGPNTVGGQTSFPCDYPPLPCAPQVPEPPWEAVPNRTRAHGGRYALERQIIPFEVEDLPFQLNLHHLRAAAGLTDGNRGPVLLAHGAGVRAEMFYGQPLGETIVDRLLREGYDVWALNWRGSIDFPNNAYTLDEVARYDHPAAVKEVLARTGAPKLRALVHCQGSVSFMIAAVSGYLTDEETKEELVSDVVSSAISLFFEVPDRTWLKQRLTLPAVTLVASGADPQWGIRAVNTAAKVLARISTAAERPCNNAPCQIANFIYGAGWDVLLCHANVDDAVHAWTARELGYTPFSLISQVAESSRYGHIVPSWDRAPASYVSRRPTIRDARFTLLGCTEDTMFEAKGQERTVEFLKDCGVQAAYVPLGGYGHMDAYWGRHAAAEVFPSILDGLSWSETGVDPGERVPARVGRDGGAACAPGLAGRWRARSQGSSDFSAPPPARSRVT
ncbi:MAG TPA: hypothetical protein VHY83_15615 [Solirubrobacteraceae bacterium]|nr:hypothetical protein [Solirubrobacteraceae bacterium]